MISGTTRISVIEKLTEITHSLYSTVFTELATVPHSETDGTRPQLSSRLFQIHFNGLGLPVGLFPSGLAAKTLYFLLFHACYVPLPSLMGPRN
jgi:hypothetical protein